LAKVIAQTSAQPITREPAIRIRFLKLVDLIRLTVDMDIPFNVRSMHRGQLNTLCARRRSLKCHLREFLLTL